MGKRLEQTFSISISIYLYIYFYIYIKVNEKVLNIISQLSSNYTEIPLYFHFNDQIFKKTVNTKYRHGCRIT